MDYMNAINNDELLKAIEEMKKDNSPENQSCMLDLMVESEFLTPVCITPAPETNGATMINMSLAPDAKIKFHMIENGKGKKYFLAFTSFDEMKKWRPKQDNQTIIQNFDDYAGMLQKAVGDGQIVGFVIDPFGSNIAFTKEQTIMIKEVKDGRKADAKKHPIKAGVKVFLEEPSNYPDKMVEAIKEYLSKQDNVQRAYLQLMRQADEQSYVIALEYNGDRHVLFEGIAKIARPYLNDVCLDIMGTDNELGRKIIDIAEPFWEK